MRVGRSNAVNHVDDVEHSSLLASINLYFNFFIFFLKKVARYCFEKYYRYV